MDLSPCELSYSQRPRWFSSSSDSDFCSLSSPETGSPACSWDVGISPLRVPTWPDCRARAPRLCQPGAASKGKRRKTWSKNPSKQRQNASEKEKLRMRDLTKALHHLRTYLPPSLAPPGQTLTKIETLRLTIHYIAHLSALLGVGGAEDSTGRKEPSTQEHRPGAAVGPCHTSAVGGGGSVCTPVQKEVWSCSLDSLLEAPPAADPANPGEIYSSCPGFPLDFWI
ncbi:hypothetical protein GN956_G19576 [Arapaima gigas]